MNVKQEGLGLGPASHLLDAGGVMACQVEGHGSASSEGVAADIHCGVPLLVSGIIVDLDCELITIKNYLPDSNPTE